MIDVDKWQEIYHTLKQHKLRTTLTAFGVFWGIFMLVALLGAGKGLENGAKNQFGGQTNSVFLWIGGKTLTPYSGLNAGRRITLKQEDLDAIRLKVAALGMLSGMNNLGGGGVSQFITRGTRTGNFFTRGVEPDVKVMSDFLILKGRFINDLDIKERRKVVVIGTGVRDVLFDPDEDPVGHFIKVGGINFQVIGIYKSKTPGGARNHAGRTMIPNSTLRHTFNQTGWIGFMQFAPKTGVHASTVEQQVKDLLHERHKVHPNDTGVFRSYNMQLEYDKVQSLFVGVNVFSWFVALGTIFAGVIGVGNIMLIVVKERTREIGVRKALGATRWNIVSMVVQESLVLTTFAGYLGLVVGVFLLEGMTDALVSMSDNAMFGKPEIDFNTAFIAVLVLVISGTLAALLPAYKAAKVDPIIALQDE